MSIIEQRVTEVGLSEALRYLADMIDAGGPAPSWIYPNKISWYIDNPGEGEAPATEQVREIRKFLPRAVWEKEYNNIYAYQRASFFGVSFEILTDRGAVCKKVVTGTETVEVPDPEYVAPEVPKVTVEQDVVEWVCVDE